MAIRYFFLTCNLFGDFSANDAVHVYTTFTAMRGAAGFQVFNFRFIDLLLLYF